MSEEILAQLTAVNIPGYKVFKLSREHYRKLKEVSENRDDFLARLHTLVLGFEGVLDTDHLVTWDVTGTEEFIRSEDGVFFLYGSGPLKTTDRALKFLIAGS
jgi:hypothetical protein